MLSTNPDQVFTNWILREHSQVYVGTKLQNCVYNHDGDNSVKPADIIVLCCGKK